MPRLNAPEYQLLRRLLVDARESAGLSQAEVAGRLGRAQTFVSKYELGDRRLDVIDYLQVCDSIGADPIALLRTVWVKTKSGRALAG
ncbi:MAG: XRE family transcriptional regulator [Lysobacteraceae bacterium]|nr:MAG: XRE family transcriptional regulator [Xanthomonadaceae bacterium]